MKTVDAAYKRIYRGMKKEYGLLYRLNNIYLSNEIYAGILDINADSDADYAMDDFDIVPVGDSRISTQVTRQMRSQEALQLVMQVGGDVKFAGRKVLDALDVSDSDKYIPDGPSVEELQMQMQQMQQMMEQMQQHNGMLSQQLQSKEELRKDAEIQLKADKLELEARKTPVDMGETIAKTKEIESKIPVNIATAAEKMTQTEGQGIENAKEMIRPIEPE